MPIIIIPQTRHKMVILKCQINISCFFWVFKNIINVFSHNLKGGGVVRERERGRERGRGGGGERREKKGGGGGKKRKKEKKP